MLLKKSKFNELLNLGCEHSVWVTIFVNPKKSISIAVLLTEFKLVDTWLKSNKSGCEDGKVHVYYFWNPMSKRSASGLMLFVFVLISLFVTWGMLAFDSILEWDFVIPMGFLILHLSNNLLTGFFSTNWSGLDWLSVV